jgi:hypothetical protein
MWAKMFDDVDVVLLRFSGLLHIISTILPNLLHRLLVYSRASTEQTRMHTCAYHRVMYTSDPSEDLYIRLLKTEPWRLSGRSSASKDTTPAPPSSSTWLQHRAAQSASSTAEAALRLRICSRAEPAATFDQHMPINKLHLYGKREAPLHAQDAWPNGNRGKKGGGHAHMQT